MRTQDLRAAVRPRRLRACAALGMAALLVAGCAAIPAESQPEALPQQQRGQQTEAVPEPEPGLDRLSLVREFVEASADPASDYAAARAFLSEQAREQWEPDASVAVIEDEFSTVYTSDDESSTSATTGPTAPGERLGERDNGSDNDNGSGSGSDNDSGDEQSGQTGGDTTEEDADGRSSSAPAPTVTPRRQESLPTTTPPEEPTASSAPDEQLVTIRGGYVGRLAADSSFIPADDAVDQDVRLRKENGEWRIVDPPQSALVTSSDFDETYFRVPVHFFAPESDVLVPDLRYVVASPQSGLPARVVDLLLAGPSDGLTGAVRNPLGDSASLETNVTTTRDGAIAVPLTGVAEKSSHDKELIVAQLVRSLQAVTTSRVRLLSNGSALVQGHRDWRPGELPAYEAPATPSSDLPGLMTADGRVYSLGNGSPIPGPAGKGQHHVLSAAQSLGGDQLAVVERAADRVRLRIGPYGSQGQEVELDASRMTRPTWVPATTRSEQSREVWTVTGGERVVQVVTDAEGRWVTQSVNSAEINPIGDIDQLRLSRDGTRAAMVVGGKVVVAAVARDSESRASVALRAPRVLQGDELDDAVALDWTGQDALAVATQSDSSPVVRVPLDGLRVDQFNSSNLIAPMRGITAAPGRPTVVADATGLWTASDLGDVWRPHDQRSSSGVPFYPG